VVYWRIIIMRKGRYYNAMYIIYYIIYSIFYSPQINHYRISIASAVRLSHDFSRKFDFSATSSIEMRALETSTSFQVYPVVLRSTRTYNNNNIICGEKIASSVVFIWFTANIAINHRLQQTKAGGSVWGGGTYIINVR